MVRGEVPQHLCTIIELGNMQTKGMAAAAWRNLSSHPGVPTALPTALMAVGRGGADSTKSRAQCI